MAAITATELVQHTRQTLDRVARSGETVAVMRDQTEIARLVTAQARPAMTADEALQGLDAAGLTVEQAGAWLRDSRGYMSRNSGRNPDRNMEQNFGHDVRDPWV